MSDKGRKIINIILALLVSMAAWVFVVYNYDPMTRRNTPGSLSHTRGLRLSPTEATRWPRPTMKESM